ncbi:PD40 domain-containing protein [bacterium]|nr:PD40 domain-containing protein [bacterium]
MQKIISTFLSIAILATVAFCQFGRNKVQYSLTNWYYVTTPDFKIYYPAGYENLVDFAKIELERGLDRLSNDFSYTPQDKISILIYPTRFDFQETNVISSILPEGVGGFTELLKNRVVIPFNGNWEDFRHVLTHELTHAFSFEFLYGNSPAGVLSLSRVFQIPLWLAEGSAEFESLNWDSEADMYMRDAILNDYIAPPDQLGGFLVYKEGQSMLYYIAERWGRKKIGEIFAKGRMEVSTDRVLKAALGIGLDDFYRDWKLWVRRRYFPQIEGHNLPKEVATRITDHEKSDVYMNLQPVYNPKKDQIAYISNKNDYIDIFTVDVPTGITRRIVKGERSGESQSFHPFDSRMSISADGKYLIHSVKLGYCDGISIVDIKRKKRIRTLRFDTLGIREISSPYISNDGNKIIFAGLHHEKRDIFITDSLAKTVKAITDDIYDENYPMFSPDNKQIVFSSDRPIGSSGATKKFPKKYGEYNIFVLDLITDEISPITNDGLGNKYPSFSPDGKKIAFTSMSNGVANIFIADLDKDTTYALTDLVCAAYTPSWSNDGEKLAFSAFWHGGWDIFILEKIEPIDHKLKIFETAFKKIEQTKPDTSESANADTSSSSKVPLVSGELSKYRFDAEKQDSTSPKKYRPQFSADLMMVNFGYSSYYGLEGSSILMLSDVLGNHQIYLATDLYQNLDNSNFYLAYGYLRHRTNFYFTGFHYKNYFYDNWYRLFSDRYYGGNIYAYYPFSQFSRAELGAGMFAVDRYFYDPPYDDNYSENLTLNSALVFDNTLWGFTGPLAGARHRVEVEAIPKIGRNPQSYWASEIDLRQYYHFGKGYSFAFRLAGGYSDGEHPKKYYLGGMNQWFNYTVSKNDVYSITDIYISKMVFPLHGYDYFQFVGNSYALCNFEFRYPFVRYLDLGFPPITIRGINGALFTDIGSVASKPYSNFQGMKEGKLKDLKMGLGFGMRSWIWMFAFHYDIAWTTDLKHISPKPKYYFSLGLEF